MRIKEIVFEIDLNSFDGKIKFLLKIFIYFLNFIRYLFEYLILILILSGEIIDFMSYSKFIILFWFWVKCKWMVGILSILRILKLIWRIGEFLKCCEEVEFFCLFLWFRCVILEDVVIEMCLKRLIRIYDRVE